LLRLEREEKIIERIVPPRRKGPYNRKENSQSEEEEVERKNTKKDRPISVF
jgi:hypothetical protein